jgi:hypothetical protein
MPLAENTFGKRSIYWSETKHRPQVQALQEHGLSQAGQFKESPARFAFEVKPNQEQIVDQATQNGIEPFEQREQSKNWGGKEKWRDSALTCHVRQLSPFLKNCQLSFRYLARASVGRKISDFIDKGFFLKRFDNPLRHNRSNEEMPGGVNRFSCGGHSPRGRRSGKCLSCS